MVMEAKYGVGEYEEKWSTEELTTELKITTQSVNRICRNAMDKVRGVGLGFHAVGA
jgi:DNA-directed RNA polymerase sigma subunit (sigma70/sigma32)